MKIVVLDGYTLNPGDLSWDSIASLGELFVYDRTAPSEIISRVDDARIVLTNKVVLTEDILRNLPGLKYVGILATGYNVIDISAAVDLGITVTNIPAYSTDSVAQSVFAHILAMFNRVEHYANENRRGRWSACADFSYCDSPVRELAGKTMGIVGFGNIGSRVACIADAFGMNVMAFTSRLSSDLPWYVRKSDLDELFRESDIVSLHCPLNDATFNLVDDRRLSMMKRSAVLINTGRGSLVDERALSDALNSGTIAGAGVDVLSSEPPSVDNPLLSARNCHITPHIGWASVEARTRLMKIAATNIRAFLNGTPCNVVVSPKEV